MKLVKLNKDSLKEIGYRETYDLEIDDKNHNFVLSNGLVTSNSHSCAYAMNAYVSQYLKVHYPMEYYCALLNNSTSEDISTYIKQASVSGIEFGGCCYGECSNNFEVDYEKNIIKFGLSSIKGIRVNDIETINNSYAEDGRELIRFICNKKMNKKTIEVLSRLGFFKKIIHKNYCFVENLIFKLKESKPQDFDYDYDEYFKYANRFIDYSAGEKSKAEKEYLGFYFNEHPFSIFYEKLFQKRQHSTYVRPKDLTELNKGIVSMIGLVSEIKMLKGKKSGKEYYKIVLEDDEQQVNVTIFETVAVNNLNIGDIINISVNINDFGISKNKKQHIRILESAAIALDKDKMRSFDQITKTVLTDSWF